MRVVFAILLAAVAAPIHGAESVAAPAASPIFEPVREGQELAAKLRSAFPAENSEFSGVLEITDRAGKPVAFVPVVSKVVVTETNWHVTYRVAPTNGAPAETLVIWHAPDQSSQYSLTVGTNAAATAPLTRSFAGSDFWLLDLGLEFCHWPQQRALRAEMSRGRPCRVLESVTPRPAPDSYARVLSWIDNETGGVLQAEAYDGQGKLLKKFSLGSFQKLDGRWQLRDMRIRNVRTGRQTELKFNLNDR
jgi:hypothetical protein